MLRIRRNPDGTPMLHETGQAVRVEDGAGNASWAPVTDLPAELPASERAEVARALGQDPGPVAPDPATPADPRPPVISPAQVQLLAEAGVTLSQTSPASPLPAHVGDGTPAGGATPQPEAKKPAETRRTQAEPDPVILEARRRAAQAAAARQEAAAAEAQARLELTRRRVYQDRQAGGTGGGPAAGEVASDTDQALREAQRRRDVAQALRDAAIAEAEAEQARAAAGHLSHKLEAKEQGTTFPQLFCLGFGGFALGALIAIPLREAITAAGGSAGTAEVAGMLLSIAGAWFVVWARLRRIAAGEEGQRRREDRQALRERMEAYWQGRG